MAAENIENSYKNRVQDIINQSFTGFGLSLAYQAGIIQVLVTSDVPMTSQEVADAKGLKERYVRELLNGLACAHLVDVEKVDGSLKYNISKEDGSVFEPTETPMLQLMASCAVRFQSLRDCLLKDGPYGLPYGDFPESIAGNDRVSKARLETDIDLMLKNTPGIKAKLEAGINVIEAGCGSAFFLSNIAQRFPNSKFIGSDYCAQTLEFARKSVAPLELKNLELIQLDLLKIPEEHAGKYDLAIVNDVIHDLPDAEKGLHSLRLMLKAGGYLAMFDIGVEGDVMIAKDIPGMAIPFFLSSYHCVPQGYHNADSNPLGCTWGKEKAVRLSEKAGFKVLGQYPYAGFFILYVCQAP